MNQSVEIIARTHRQEILDSVQTHHLETKQWLEIWKTLRQRFTRTRKPIVPVNPEACLC